MTKDSSVFIQSFSRQGMFPFWEEAIICGMMIFLLTTRLIYCSVNHFRAVKIGKHSQPELSWPVHRKSFRMPLCSVLCRSNGSSKYQNWLMSSIWHLQLVQDLRLRRVSSSTKFEKSPFWSFHSLLHSGDFFFASNFRKFVKISVSIGLRGTESHSAYLEEGCFKKNNLST